MSAAWPMFLRMFFLSLALGLLAHPIFAAEKAKSGPAAVAARPGPKGTLQQHPPAGPAGPAGPSGKAMMPGKSTGKPVGQPKSNKTPKPLKRPAKLKKPPNPEELKVRPDAEGLLRFNFNGQPWPAVLEWLARVSKMSLDWQELPGDYLNLSTQRGYTVEQTRDLVNRHLLARGYTMLCQGEQMTVANVKQLNPSLVPRVRLEELRRLNPYEFVKVSFSLDWLLAETLVDELKPLLSPNGKLVPLAASNRLEAMDAAVNLREIHKLLQDEQSLDNRQRLVREFPLSYARAEDVRDQLQMLVGVGAGAKPGGGGQAKKTPQLPPELLKKLGNNAGKSSPAAAKTKTDVILVVNQRRNSILVRAKADKMAIIREAIKAIDVPLDRSRSLLANMGRMRVYRLVGVEPEPVVKTLQAMGDLDPATRLEVDMQNKAIIAYASMADHMMIQAVVDKLSGSQRSFEVRRLRRLAADEVAGTIVFMMGREPQKEKQQARPWWWGSSRGGESSKERADAFRVDADVEHNRLLLWANEIELAEVDNLLVKLGELPAKRRSEQTTRVIDAGGREQTEALIERIRRAWPSVGANPLLLPPDEEKGEKPRPRPRKETPKEKPPRPASETTTQRLVKNVFHFVAHYEEKADRHRSAATQKAEIAAESPPPLKLEIAPDGRLAISCPDTEALDRLEELIVELSASRQNYRVFRLKYADAYIVSLNLEEFFEAEPEQQSRRPWWIVDNSADDEAELRLSKRRKLEFISDYDTNSILVKGADPQQLRTIEELIRIYDQPPPQDSQTARQTAVFHLRYAKAADVSTAIKDVYRDLLSANDKALVGGPRQRSSQQTRRIIFSYDDYEQKPQKAPKFKGLLSIGVDEGSNTLVVSAPGFLFDQIRGLIAELDEAAAANNAVRVVKVGPGTSAAALQAALKNALGDGSSSSGTSTRRRESSDRDRRQSRSARSRTNGS